METRMKITLFKSKIIFPLCLILILFFPIFGYSQDSEVMNYPTRPITFIIPLPPGGASELGIRMLIKHAEKYLGQPIVPLNKPGAGLTIGMAEIAKAKPDGYTIGFSAFGPMLVVPFLQKVPYHSVKDFRQIMQFTTSNPGLVVRVDSPFKSLKDIIDSARKSSKKLTFGAVSIGLNPTIIKKIAQKEGVEISHMPFGATGEAETALLGGHIDMVSGDFNYAFIEAGKTRLLVIFREERAEEYPQTPILRELGYNIPCRLFMGVQGPKGIPEGIVKKIEEAFTKAMKEPDFVKGMKDLRFPIFYRNSKELGDYVTQGYEIYREFLK